jgi:cardiolipin synthase
METYILDDDEVGQRFVQALIAKQRQGVQVNLIRDSVGTLGTPAAFFAGWPASGIAGAGVQPAQPAGDAQGLGTEPARPPQAADRGRPHGLPGRHQHQQRLLGRLVRQGARQTRTGRRHLAWRDTDLQLQGPVVAELQKLFLAAWAAQPGRRLPATTFRPP